MNARYLDGTPIQVGDVVHGTGWTSMGGQRAYGDFTGHVTGLAHGLATVRASRRQEFWVTLPLRAEPHGTFVQRLEKVAG